MKHPRPKKKKKTKQENQTQKPSSKSSPQKPNSRPPPCKLHIMENFYASEIFLARVRKKIRMKKVPGNKT